MLNREVSWLKLVFRHGGLCQSLPRGASDAREHGRNHPQPRRSVRGAPGAASWAGAAGASCPVQKEEGPEPQ